jgi:small subunit ribosomal protein S15e
LLPYLPSAKKMEDVEVEAGVTGAVPKKRTFRKYSYRGVDLDQLLDMSTDELVKLFPARARRRFQRGLKRKPMALIKKLRKAKKDAPAGEKPEGVRTHLRNMIIVPEMIGSIIGVYNGKTFNQVEIKPEMIGHYLAEFSISYKPVKHGRPGIGATHSSRFIPLNAEGAQHTVWEPVRRMVPPFQRRAMAAALRLHWNEGLGTRVGHGRFMST